MGPAHHDDTVTPHTRPPADADAEHMLMRTVECTSGSVEVEMVCDPMFDYGRTPADWSIATERHVADASGAGETIRMRTDSRSASKPAAPGDTVRDGRSRVLRTVLGRPRRPATLTRRNRDRRDLRLLALLVGELADPGPPVPGRPAAFRVDRQGPVYMPTGATSRR